MLKFVTLSLLLASTSAFAQQCPDLGWTNAGILDAALEKKSEELMDVKYLMVDQKKGFVAYVLEGESKTKKFSYKTCGQIIDFGPTL